MSRCSSVAEQPIRNRHVAGSSPASGSKEIKMKEVGQVIEKNKNIVKIKLIPSKTCHSCGLCKTKNEFILEALDDCNANIGDFVIIEIKKKNYYKVMFLIYLFPLISFILGVLIGYFIGEKFKFDPQLAGFLLGLTFTITSYIFINLLDKRLTQKENIITVVKKIV